MQKKLTFGMDPEFLAAHSVKDTLCVFPLCQRVPGTKQAPVPVRGHPGFFQQLDGVALELNTPVVAAEEMPELCSQTVAIADELIERYSDGQAELSLRGSLPDNPETGLRFPESLEIGCDLPSNAYIDGGLVTDEIALIPDQHELVRYKFAGAHLHIGHDLAVPSFVVALWVDALAGGRLCGSRRGQHFGRDGAYRPKPYGTEYRVPDPDAISPTCLGKFANVIQHWWRWACASPISAQRATRNALEISSHIWELSSRLRNSLPPSVNSVLESWEQIRHRSLRA